VALANLLENRTAIVELCSDDWDAALSQLSYGPSRLVSCVPPGVRDRDPAPDLQPDCLGRFVDPEGHLLIDLPACGSGKRPCLMFQPESVCDGSGTSVSIDYDCLRPRGTQIELLCGTEL
jgi:hypothetical protein